MVNLLPLAEGETDLDRARRCPRTRPNGAGCTSCSRPRAGTVRRNSMDAFTNIPTAGKIAMKFGAEDGDDDDGGDDDDERRRQPRPADRGRIADRGGRRPARHPQRQGDPLQVDRRARIPERATRWACAASGCSATTRSSRCRSCAASAPRQEEREAYLKLPALARQRGREGLADRTLRRDGRQGAVPADRSPRTAMASARRPTNIAAPTAAARASSTSSRRSATAASSPASRSARASS